MQMTRATGHSSAHLSEQCGYANDGRSRGEVRQQDKRVSMLPSG